MPWATHRFSSHGGQACDLEGADVLPPLIESDLLLADKGFDADQRVLIPWKQARKTAVIPPKANRKLKRHYDKELYKTRHLIEISLPNSNCFAPSLHVTTVRSVHQHGDLSLNQFQHRRVAKSLFGTVSLRG
jgi:transposase